MAEISDDQTRAQPFGLAAQKLDMRGGPFISFDRAIEFLLDPGAEYLDRDISSLSGDRAMDLRDGSGADRHWVDRRKELLGRAAERGFDRRLDSGERLRGKVVLQLAKIVGGGEPDEVWAGGKCLAELDRGWANRFQCGGVIGGRGHRQTEPRNSH